MNNHIEIILMDSFMYEIMGVVALFLLPKSLIDVASLCSYTLVFAVFAVIQLIELGLLPDFVNPLLFDFEI